MTLRRRMRVLDGTEEEEALQEPLLRVGFASTDMTHVNQHFGTTKGLVIYGVNPDDAYLIEAIGFDYVNPDENEGKLAEKIDALNGCVALYSEAIGSSAAQKLLHIGVQPVKVHDGAEIENLIKYLQEEMLAGPSTWLAKAIERHKNPDPARFNAMEFEQWDE